MKPEAQNIAIAQACGWRKSSFNNQWLVPKEPKEDSFFIGNPLNDLNAMHEAEKLLKSEQHFTFQVELARVINTTTYPLNFALLHATATQRAEAFLRTLNLWTT